MAVATGAHRLIYGQYRRAAGAGAQPLADPRHADVQRLSQGRRGSNVVPQPAFIDALKGAQMQNAEQTPGDEAATDADIAIGHQLHEADQHSGEEDLGHPPVFEHEKDAGQPALQAIRQRNLVHQQNDGDQAERGHELHKEQEEGAKAGVVFIEHDARDLHQRHFTGDPCHLHVNEGEQVSQYQHKQRHHRVGQRALPGCIPAGGQRMAAARTGCLVPVCERWQHHQQVALRTQNVPGVMMLFAHAHSLNYVAFLSASRCSHRSKASSSAFSAAAISSNTFCVCS